MSWVRRRAAVTSVLAFTSRSALERGDSLRGVGAEGRSDMEGEAGLEREERRSCFSARWAEWRERLASSWALRKAISELEVC